MTSENLSLGEKFKNHRTIINRTLWTSYVALPFLAADFILGVIMMVSRAINYAEVYRQSAEVLHQEKLRAVSKVIGMEGNGWILVTIIAIMFALQGFSYIFNQSQLDFYMSQPTTRAQRIRRNFFNAITTYLILYMFCMLLALIVAAAMGAVNSYVILSVLLEALNNFILFLAFYNMTVLAVILSGTLPIAIILTGCFVFIPLIVAGELYLYKNMFFATFSTMTPFKVYLSPLVDIFSPMGKLGTSLLRGDALLSMAYISRGVSAQLPFILDTLAVAVIAMVFILIFARSRQAEWAGKSIPLRPFRWIVKIAACVVIGLGSGYVVYIIYSSVWNNKLYTMMIFIMILATIITGCIVEVILEGNIRKFFKGMAQTVMALAIVVLVFVLFRGDLLGYDSYVPAADKVVSGALISDYNSFNRYAGNYYAEDFSRADTMFLTDTEDLVKVAEAGMKNRKELAKDEERGIYTNGGFDTTVLYRMADGREIYRSISIPYEGQDDALDRLVSSEEYKKGHFEVFIDDDIRAADAIATNHDLRYVIHQGYESLSTDAFSYAEVSDAYRQDILENFSFSYMKDNLPIAGIEYENADGENYIFGTLEVYENYTHTIELMKKYGIYSDSKVDLDSVKEIQVTNYYPGYDLETTSYEEIDGDVPSVIETYTDRESMEEIFKNVISSGYYNPWFNYNNLNDQYSVEVIRNNDNPNYGGIYYSFRAGKVPDFVKEDTN
jgi:ABC-2 type transport system permease protein